MTRNDRDLLEQWRNGDRQAGNRLVARHFSTLYRFFRGKLDEDVADLVQRTFLACVGARDRVPDGVVFKAYLLGIANNQLLMHLRSRHRRRRVLETTPVTGLAEGPSPSHVAALREEQQLLLRALRSLPLAQQTVLQLFYWEQLSIAEISKTLGVAPGTIKSRLHTGRASLRHKIVTLAGTHTVRDTITPNIERWVRSLGVATTDSLDTPQ